MKNKQFLEKSLELIAFGEHLLSEAKDRQEIRELQQAIKVQKQIIRSTGWRQPRIKPEVAIINDPDIFRKAKAKVDAERNGEIIKEIEERKAEKPVNQKTLDNAKKDIVKKLNSGKKINTSAKDKEEVKALYNAGNPIPYISETLWILEDSVYKILGIGASDSKAVLADNSNNDKLDD